MGNGPKLGIAAGILAVVAVAGFVANVPLLLYGGIGAAIIAGVAAVGLVVAAGAANRQSEETEKDKRIMNMPLDTFADKQAEDLAAKYGEARPRRERNAAKEAAALAAQELNAKLDREKGHAERTASEAARNAGDVSVASSAASSTVDSELEATRAKEIR